MFALALRYICMLLNGMKTFRCGNSISTEASSSANDNNDVVDDDDDHDDDDDDDNVDGGNDDDVVTMLRIVAECRRHRSERLLFES